MVAHLADVGPLDFEFLGVVGGSLHPLAVVVLVSVQVFGRVLPAVVVVLLVVVLVLVVVVLVLVVVQGQETEHSSLNFVLFQGNLKIAHIDEVAITAGGILAADVAGILVVVGNLRAAGISLFLREKRDLPDSDGLVLSMAAVVGHEEDGSVEITDIPWKFLFFREY